MKTIKTIRDRLTRLRQKISFLVKGKGAPLFFEEPQMLVRGWDRYAQTWDPQKFAILPGQNVRYIGDEWTVEDASSGDFTNYGLSAECVKHFEAYLQTHLFEPYLPPSAQEGMEIGPGGGRITEYLIPKTRILHLVEPSHTMIQHLQHRFAHVSSLRYHHSDGINLPDLPPASLDYALAFDVFVHFEPRLVYWYLCQLTPLLKPGGIGILHYANIATPAGWKQFELDLATNLKARSNFLAFGVMCPQLMSVFLGALGLGVISLDTRVIPRDAITVFQKPPDGS